MNRITYSQLITDFKKIGICSGDTIMIHTSVSKAGPLLGGVNIIVEALLSCLGEKGTIMAYADWDTWFEEEDMDNPDLVKEIPPFNSLTALGHNAENLCMDHPLNYGYGKDSPFEKLIECGGKILMLGAPLGTLTILHYAEHTADIPDKRIRRYKRKLIINGKVKVLDLEEFDTDNPVRDIYPKDHFERIAKEYLESGRGEKGKIGNAESYLFNAKALVEFGKKWLKEYFLKLK